MDLIERGQAGGQRHPWEVARSFAIAELVARLGIDPPSTLDVGCGDAYLVRELLNRGVLGSAVGQDIHLTQELASTWSDASLRLVRELAELEGLRFQLVLLLDVLEHIEDPAPFLRRLTQTHLERDGHVVITVPSFQALFSEHDRELKHYRRYARSEIAGVATAAGLSVLDSGYLFSSLLVPRALSALAERFVPARPRNDIGVGHWKAPALLTRWLTRYLRLDNRLALAAHDRGVTLPGLSAWLLCNAPS